MNTLLLASFSDIAQNAWVWFLAPIGAVAALVGGLVTALVMSTVISWAQAAGFAEGALVGLMVAVGFLIPMNGVNYLFEHRPRKLFLINAGHDLTNLVVMGVILGAWRLPSVRL